MEIRACLHRQQGKLESFKQGRLIAENDLDSRWRLLRNHFSEIVCKTHKRQILAPHAR